ncbi:MAG: hypothetical protein JOZ15_18500, partial [Acidobacteria bacterium]|nr:hypothetical protein [Acidobacteriota bacterium]
FPGAVVIWLGLATGRGPVYPPRRGPNGEDRVDNKRQSCAFLEPESRAAVKKIGRGKDAPLGVFTDGKLNPDFSVDRYQRPGFRGVSARDYYIVRARGVPFYGVVSEGDRERCEYWVNRRIAGEPETVGERQERLWFEQGHAIAVAARAIEVEYAKREREDNPDDPSDADGFASVEDYIAEAFPPIPPLPKAWVEPSEPEPEVIEPEFSEKAVWLDQICQLWDRAPAEWRQEVVGILLTRS